MKLFKRLKDPIYGYIDIPANYMTGIVDTSNFQRLRRIIQTSYSPLYSSAVHNRFVHSMGVYHLGEIAFFQLKKEIKDKLNVPINIQAIEKVFLLSCLLHDIGHAPFSHTGEEFYLNEKKEYSDLHAELIARVGITTFETDVPTQKSAAAAPHEIMSSILGLKEYAEFFLDAEEREFFARCITGYKYSNQTLITSLKNCFISLLNSKVIDVDKLDYLIRDAFSTGFDTVNIDYERLLTSLTITLVDDRYELAYYKSAISVIENVVYAHDSERKWIQSHPIVLYETYILQHIIATLCNDMGKSGKKLFSLESLDKDGQSFDKNLNIRLMCDDDIIYLMKNVYVSDLSIEFFERKFRRHPVWKSEAEYKAFLLGLTSGGDLLNNFEKAMEATALYLVKSTESWVIDEKLIAKIQQELIVLETAKLEEKSKIVQRKNKQDILKVVKCLKRYADEKNIDCNFIILRAAQFNSGFGKPDFSNTNVVFPMKDKEKVAKVGDIILSLKAKEKERENFFYLFYKRKDGEDIEVDNQELCSNLIKEFF